MFKILKKWINKSLAKDITSYLYTKYDIEIEYINGNIDVKSYERYCYYDKEDILEHFMKPNKSYFISNGIAISIANNVKTIKAIPKDEKRFYFYNKAFTSLPYAWYCEDEITKNNIEFEPFIKIKEDN